MGIHTFYILSTERNEGESIIGGRNAQRKGRRRKKKG
jgi:hypothetical protein